MPKNPKTCRFEQGGERHLIEHSMGTSRGCEKHGAYQFVVAYCGRNGFANLEPAKGKTCSDCRLMEPKGRLKK